MLWDLGPSLELCAWEEGPCVGGQSMGLGLGKDANHGSAAYWLQSCGRGAGRNVGLVVGRTDGLTCGDLLTESQVVSPRGDPHGARTHGKPTVSRSPHARRTQRPRRTETRTEPARTVSEGSAPRGCRARRLRHDLCDRALRWRTPDSAALENSDAFLGKSLNPASLCR